jgi:hypothetical protein
MLITIERRGSRKVIIAPDDSDALPSRAHRWKRMPEGGMLIAGKFICEQPSAAAHR